MTILGTLLFMVSINPLITLVVVVLTPNLSVCGKFHCKKTYVCLNISLKPEVS